jgi:glycosyltransferase involved in cell wall biosynthesis
LDRTYRVSALVSCYNSAALLRGCLDDLIGQTLYRQNELEIIVIDSGSTQDEHVIVADYQRRHPHIRLLRTERETLYAAWNRGIEVARGRFVTNANTDDAHRPDALELLARALEHFPDADLSYGYSVFTRMPNDVYPGKAGYFECRLPPFTPALGMLYCLLGPHPLWRRRVFSRIGLFDPAFSNAGDYDFQMRFIEAGLSAVVVPEILSLFFQNPKGLSLSSRQTLSESKRIEARYRALIPIHRLYEIDSSEAHAAAKAWVAQGNLALTWECAWQKHPQKEFDYAYRCYAKALELMPGYEPAVRNIAACLAAQGKWAAFGRWASVNPQVKDLERSAAARQPPPLLSVEGVRVRSSPTYRATPISLFAGRRPTA